MGENCSCVWCGVAGYGSSGSPPKIPGGASLDFEVELFDWAEKEKEPWQMSIDEKVALLFSSHLSPTPIFSWTVSLMVVLIRKILMSAFSAAREGRGE